MDLEGTRHRPRRAVVALGEFVASSLAAAAVLVLTIESPAHSASDRVGPTWDPDARVGREVVGFDVPRLTSIGL
jgi:hypothetical protein